jgi:hypothetical protein
MDPAILTGQKETKETKRKGHWQMGFGAFPSSLPSFASVKKQHDCRVFTFDADLVGRICRP